MKKGRYHLGWLLGLLQVYLRVVIKAYEVWCEDLYQALHEIGWSRQSFTQYRCKCTLRDLRKWSLWDSICTACPSLINPQGLDQEKKERLHMVHGYGVRETTELFDIPSSCVNCFAWKKKLSQVTGFMKKGGPGMCPPESQGGYFHSDIIRVHIVTSSEYSWEIRMLGGPLPQSPSIYINFLILFNVIPVLPSAQQCHK